MKRNIEKIRCKSNGKKRNRKHNKPIDRNDRRAKRQLKERY